MYGKGREDRADELKQNPFFELLVLPTWHKPSPTVTMTGIGPTFPTPTRMASGVSKCSSRSVSRWAWVLFLFSKALWMTNYEIKVKLNKQDANVQWARRRQMYRQEWIGRGTVCLCQVETTDCQSGDQLQQKLQQKFYKQLIQVQSDTFIRGPNGLLLRLSNYIKLWLGRESKFSHMG